MGLTAKQQEDVNFAILEYLMKQGFKESVDTFTKEAKVDFEGYLKNSNSPP